MWWFVILVVFAFTVYLNVIKPMDYWKKRKIIHSKPWPIVGHMSAIITRSKSIVTVFEDLYQEFPDKRYNGFYGVRQPQILLRDPELIKQITTKDFDNFINRTSQVSNQADPILSKMLLSLNDQEWRDMRSLLSPSFTSNKMKFMFQLISECAQRFSDHFYKQSLDTLSVDLKDIFTRFTNDAIATAAFGITVDSLNDKNNEFFVMGRESMTPNFSRVLRFLGYTFFPVLMRFFKVALLPINVSTFFKRVINETIEIREKNGVVRPDMIHLLLQTRVGKPIREGSSSFASSVEKAGSHIAPLSNDDITAQALLFFFGGFETTSTLLCFMSHELAVNPEIQKRLQEEIDEAFIRCNGKVTYETLQGMNYMDMVVSETLRKWPPGIAVERKCFKDYIIEPQMPDEEPCLIEKDISVVISVIGLHRDPKYFPDPETFNPERFSDENKSNIVSGTYLPFGLGPRNCIASRFALMEAKILFCYLLSKLDIVPTEKTPIPLTISKKKFSLEPEGGFWVGFKQRRKNL